MFCTKSFGHRIGWIGKPKSRIPFCQEDSKELCILKSYSLVSWQSSCLRETLAWELLKKRPLWPWEPAECGRAHWISASAFSALSQAEARLGGMRGGVSFPTGFHSLCSGLAQGRTGGGRPLSSALLPVFCRLDILPLMLRVLIKPWLSEATQCCLSLRPALIGQCFMLQSFHFLCPYKLSYSSVPLRPPFS